jgi:predicted nucleic acid-binding protein
MTDEPTKPELTQEEIDAQSAEQLPDREAMSLIDANVAAPVNAAVAANILSDDSIAYANAEQDVDITQSN